MSLAEVRAFGFATSIRKNMELQRQLQLQEKYEHHLLRRYRITKEELEAIQIQAYEQNWPVPAYPADQAR